MPILNVKPAGSCKYDMLALGEVMLRFDPGEGRVRTAREFKVWEGGGEYMSPADCAAVSGLRTALANAFADKSAAPPGFHPQGGVDMTYVKWRPYDGVGRSVRNGLNFTGAALEFAAPSACRITVSRHLSIEGGRFRLGRYLR
jgi:2-dehydro-3-deoxygluconokinase